nr:MAG: zinc-binding loop region of homing endonuclease [Bacteriophage sp.]
MKLYKDNIPNHPGYHVTKSGTILSRYSGKKLTSTYHVKKVSVQPNGYLKVMLHGNQYLVHRLVAEAYIPNPNNLPVVMHLDDNRSNNVVDNLMWGTFKDNMGDALKKGRIRSGKESPNIKFSGIGNARASLTLRKIRRLNRLKDIRSQTYIAKRLSVSQPTISHFINNKSYSI